MKLDDITPDMIEGASMSLIESWGLPPEIVDQIKERGVFFRWEQERGRYIAIIPKLKRKRIRAK